MDLRVKKKHAKVSVEGFSKHKFGIFNVEKDTTYYVSFSNLSGIKEAPKYYQEYEDLKAIRNMIFQ